MKASRLGDNIRAWRHRRGWIQEDLAERSGCTKQTISRVERGEQNVTLSALLRIGEALHVEMPELFTEQPDSGEFRLQAPSLATVVGLIIDPRQDLTSHQKYQAAFLLALELEGRITVDDHEALIRLLRKAEG